MYDQFDGARCRLARESAFTVQAYIQSLAALFGGVEAGQGRLAEGPDGLGCDG